MPLPVTVIYGYAMIFLFRREKVVTELGERTALTRVIKPTISQAVIIWQFSITWYLSCHQAGI